MVGSKLETYRLKPETKQGEQEMQSKRGFTLIELLVVIAIIAILAAILFPVFAKAREKARQATCTSNNKQVAMAAMQYVQDYDETYPLTYCCPGGSGPASYAITGWSTYGVMLGLEPYMKSSKALYCPSSQKIMFPSTKSAYTTFLWGSTRNGYSGASAAQVKAPASIVSTIEQIDGIANDPRGMADAGFRYGQSNPGPHSDGGVLSFADGHVKWYNFTSMPTSSPTWDTNKISFDVSYQP